MKLDKDFKHSLLNLKINPVAKYAIPEREKIYFRLYRLGLIKKNSFSVIPFDICNDYEKYYEQLWDIHNGTSARQLKFVMALAGLKVTIISKKTSTRIAEDCEARISYLEKLNGAEQEIARLVEEINEIHRDIKDKFDIGESVLRLYRRLKELSVQTSIQNHYTALLNGHTHKLGITDVSTTLLNGVIL